MAQSKQKRFLELYQPVHDKFERFCRARAFGDLPYQDLINEALLIAYSKTESLKNDKAFLSYLISIAIRILANSKRKMRPESGVDEFVFINHPDSSQSVEKKFEVEMLHKALAKLPELQREALILFEITGYSIKEIMEIQQSSNSAVKQRLSRGRKELAVIVRQYMHIASEDASTKVHSSKH